MNRIIPVLLLLSVVLSYGCGGPKKPEGFPDTVPFTLTVVRDGSPLADANVQLIPQSSSDAVTGGTSDANGVVSLKTVRGNYLQPGTPVGTFKVVVSKDVKVPEELPIEEINKMSPDESMAYTQKIEAAIKKAKPEVANKFNAPETTPLSITVAAGGSETIQVTAN